MHMTHAGAARVAAATGRGHATRLRARHRAGRLPAAAGAAGRPLKAVKAESRAQAAPVLHAGALRFVNIARRPAAPPSSWDLALGAVFIGTALFWSCFFVLCSSAFRFWRETACPLKGPGFPIVALKLKKSRKLL